MRCTGFPGASDGPPSDGPPAQQTLLHRLFSCLGPIELPIELYRSSSPRIQSTSATVNLFGGDLVETSCYYPNGARENYRSLTVAPEPMGFTGKEADEEVSVVYFGHRYLVPHLGR